MKGKRSSTEEKVRILREVDSGKSVVDVCREKNISDVTYHRWRKQFGQMDLSEAKRLKELERENTELKWSERVMSCSLYSIAQRCPRIVPSVEHRVDCPILFEAQCAA